jgi:hypothetical protein
MRPCSTIKRLGLNPAVLVMRPKAVLLMFMFGFAKIGVLVMFSAVAPICKLNRSLIRIRWFAYVPIAYTGQPWLHW